MIFKRLLWLSAALAATAGAAFVMVFALAFALYAFFEPYVGRAGAAGAVLLILALAIALLALIAGLKSRAPKRGRDRNGQSLGLAERLLDLVRDNPFAAAGIAGVIGLLATRNPRLIGAAVRAFVDGWQTPPKKH